MLWKSIVNGVRKFCIDVFCAQMDSNHDVSSNGVLMTPNSGYMNMKENKLCPLPSSYIEYVKDNIGVPKYIKGQLVYYRQNSCHVNSILFCDYINTMTQYHCSIIEGMVIHEDGLAYEHFWNRICDDNGVEEYVDVTMDAIATAAERNAEKRYYEIKEHEIDELIVKIANNQRLFTEETHKAINEFYAAHPEKEAEYRKGKAMVDGIVKPQN